MMKRENIVKKVAHELLLGGVSFKPYAQDAIRALIRIGIMMGFSDLQVRSMICSEVMSKAQAQEMITVLQAVGDSVEFVDEDPREAEESN